MRPEKDLGHSRVPKMLQKSGLGGSGDVPGGAWGALGGALAAPGDLGGVLEGLGGSSSGGLGASLGALMNLTRQKHPKH